MKNQLKTTKPKDRKDRRHINWGRFLFAGFLSVTMLAANTMPAFAATTVWEKANEIMKDVYTQILTISTIAAVCDRRYRTSDDEFLQIGTDG